MCHSQKKSPCSELKRKFIGHLGDKNFKIHELMVELVQYTVASHEENSRQVFGGTKHRWEWSHPHTTIVLHDVGRGGPMSLGR